MHIGDKIKARAKELRMGPTELARKIRTSKQNVYGIYQRESIDTALLHKLGKALDFDFFAYYGSSGNSSVNTPRHGYGKNKIRNSSDDETVASLKKELADVRQKYELLRALFEAKTGEKVPGSF